MSEVKVAEMVSKRFVMERLNSIYSILQRRRDAANKDRREAHIMENKEEYSYADGCYSAYCDALQLLDAAMLQMRYKEADTSEKHPENEWIPVKFREPTDEEKQEYPDYGYWADCQMPYEGQEILISLKCGRVEKDECEFDDYGYYLDSGYDWAIDVAAWMPLPKPYKEVK